jgi:hypothetical protein
MYLTLPYFTMISSMTDSADQIYSLTDLHARWLKRRRLLKGSAFGGSRWYAITFQGQTLKNLKVWNPNAKFPAKLTQSNNFRTVRDRRKLLMDHPCKIGVEESFRLQLYNNQLNVCNRFWCRILTRKKMLVMIRKALPQQSAPAMSEIQKLIHRLCA